MRHKLTLELAQTGPGTIPRCDCGWSGVPRSRHTAEGEYRAHVHQQENRRRSGMQPRPLTPLAELPDELRTAHPDAVLDLAVDGAVALILGREAERSLT